MNGTSRMLTSRLYHKGRPGKNLSKEARIGMATVLTAIAILSERLAENDACRMGQTHELRPWFFSISSNQIFPWNRGK